MPEPPARAAARRPLDRVPAARDAADRVRRPRLPHRLGLEGLPGDRRRLRARARPRACASRTGCPSRSSRRRRRRTTATTRTSTASARPSSSARSASTRSSASSIALYRFASEHAAERGILIADTKFEFGLDAEGRLVLADEAFTPDSSRFWPADEYEPGRAQPSFDKQFVRDYCETLGWDKTAPGPELPDEVVAGTRARYVEAFERLTGHRVRRLPRRPGGRARGEGDVLVRPKPGILDPQGEAVQSSLRQLGFAVEEARVGRVVDLELDGARRRRRPRRARADVRAAAREPADRELRDRRSSDERRRRSPRIAVVVFPGLERRPRRRARARALGAEPSLVWHAETGAARTSARSSCRAASRTATTSAAGRSRASRR